MILSAGAAGHPARMTQWHNIRPIITLIAFLALWWLTPPVLKRFSQDVFYEFQAPALSLQSHIQDLQSYWGLRSQSKTELIEAGRDLSRNNAILQIRLQEASELAATVERLERTLHLPPSPHFHYEVARVAERSMTAWWQQIIISKGDDHGIPVGAAVVFSGGVVGRVKQVYATTAVVELVSSPGFRMAANIEGGSEPITYTGLVSPPLEPAYGLALNVPPGLKASKTAPLRLVSSALGGIFPAGLLIGEIHQLESGQDGYFQQGQVRLLPELNHLREVAVIIPAGEGRRPPLSTLGKATVSPLNGTAPAPFSKATAAPLNGTTPSPLSRSATFPLGKATVSLPRT